MRILVESTPNYQNMGDLAMLQVCLRRLRGLWPHARISTLTLEPGRLAAVCPGVEPVPLAGRQAWFHPELAYRDKNERRDERLRRLRRRWPWLFVRAAGSQMTKGSPVPATLREFYRSLRAADLYVVAGMGSYTSDFEPDVLPMIDMIPLMRSLGVRCAAFSQGIGPIVRGSAAWVSAKAAMPKFEMIALRERRRGPWYLAELGVDSDRVVVTGDDAIEIAYEGRGKGGEGQAIGFSLRATRYSALAEAHQHRISTLVRELAKTVQAEVLSTPVSHVPEESDAATFARLFPESGRHELPITPQALVERIGRCRFVITGAYHAAVFAMAQGIPALCISNSGYYSDKFLGLADQFGTGCRVLELSDANFDNEFLEAAHHFWHEGPAYRAPLLARAVEQIDASRRAWAMLPGRLRRRWWGRVGYGR
jgi:polysaccharide pyruvyl transferase WcaK-like protein